MKCIKQLIYLSVFFLFLSTITYPTDHYVDNTVSSSGNGLSWGTAWKNFSDINWGVVEPGDIVYISGGTDSTVYYEQLRIEASGTADNLITVRNSYEAGHNGRVIIEPGSYSTDAIQIGWSANNHPDYIYIKGFELRFCNQGVEIRYACEVITMDSLIITDMGARGIHVTGGGTNTNALVDGVRADSITIKNCFIRTPISLEQETDCLYWQRCTNIWIDNNYMHTRNLNEVNNHSDVIQSNISGGTLHITNNIFISDSNAQGMPLIIGHVDFTGNDTVLIYNNYMFGGGIWTDGAPWVAVFNNAWNSYYTPQAQDYPPVIIVHNTFVSHGPYVAGVHFETPTLFANNIVAQYGDAVGFGGESGYWLATTRSSTFGAFSPSFYGWGDQHIDSTRNNILWSQWRTSADYYKHQGYFIPTDDGAHIQVYDWTDWTNGGGTGVNEDPEFVQNFLGFTQDQQADQNGELKSTSPARNQGEDLQWLIESLGYEWVDINGVARNSSPDIGAYQYVPQGPDITPPEVTGATLLDSITLKITFSEPLDQSTAQNPNNYSINNGITVVSALLTGSVVTLTTSPHAYGTYTVTVSNVEDIAGNIVSPTANSADYDWTVILDVTSPELVGVQIVDVDEVVLDFTEPLDPSQVNNLGNYIVSDQIQVPGAELNPTQTRICLTTEEHLIEHIYNIEINNLTDLSGNVISSQANSAFYKKLDIGAPGYVEHLIEYVDASATTDTNTSPQKTLDGLVNGDPDPDSRWAAEIMPQWIQFDLGEITDINLIAISFYQWNAGRIYEYSIQISNDENNWNEIVSNASSSSQEWTFNEFSPVLSARYVRIICESNNQANWAGLWEARIFEPDYPTSVETEPRTYALKQNYPNPFNPSTTIDYSVPKRSLIRLSVFNAIGQEVAILIQEEMEPGEYKITFDAANLPSGIYFYKFQSANYIETRKMVLIK